MFTTDHARITITPTGVRIYDPATIKQRQGTRTKRPDNFGVGRHKSTGFTPSAQARWRKRLNLIEWNRFIWAETREQADLLSNSTGYCITACSPFKPAKDTGCSDEFCQWRKAITRNLQAVPGFRASITKTETAHGVDHVHIVFLSSEPVAAEWLRDRVDRFWTRYARKHSQVRRHPAKPVLARPLYGAGHRPDSLITYMTKDTDPIEGVKTYMTHHGDLNSCSQYQNFEVKAEDAQEILDAIRNLPENNLSSDYAQKLPDRVGSVHIRLTPEHTEQIESVARSHAVDRVADSAADRCDDLLQQARDAVDWHLSATNPELVEELYPCLTDFLDDLEDTAEQADGMRHDPALADDAASLAVYSRRTLEQFKRKLRDTESLSADDQQAILDNLIDGRVSRMSDTAYRIYRWIQNITFDRRIPVDLSGLTTCASQSNC